MVQNRNPDQNRGIQLWKSSVAVKMVICVKIKMNGKVRRLRSLTLTVGNLSMIFTLGVNQGIYICCEEEREIILPAELGLFNVEDYTKTDIVNGEPIPSACISIGIPLSYQRAAPMRTDLNPPRGQISSMQNLLRPTFTSSSRKVHSASWKKSLFVVDVAPSGIVNENFKSI